MSLRIADYRGHLLKNLVAMPHSNFQWSPVFKENEYIGMEIEAEGVNLPGPDKIKYLWAAKEDGSLRKTTVVAPDSNGNPWEYVLKRPLSPAVCVNKALPYLRAQMEKHNSKLKFSGRCSVHVHVGVHDLRMYQIFAMVGIYYLFEELIQPLFGKEREGNLFCIGSIESPQIMDILIKDATTCFPSSNPHTKYTAVNLLTLYSLGTVEFRGMEGTVNQERLEIWIDILDKIRCYAKSLTSEKMSFLLNTMSLQGPSTMLTAIFPEGSPSYTQLMKTAIKYGGLVKLDSVLYRGIARVQGLFYEHAWSEVKDNDQVFAKTTPGKPKSFADALAASNVVPTAIDISAWSTVTGSTVTAPIHVNNTPTIVEDADAADDFEEEEDDE